MGKEDFDYTEEDEKNLKKLLKESRPLHKKLAKLMKRHPHIKEGLANAILAEVEEKKLVEDFKKEDCHE